MASDCFEGSVREGLSGQSYVRRLLTFCCPEGDLNLRRFAGVSAAGARSRNPEHFVRGISSYGYNHNHDRDMRSL